MGTARTDQNTRQRTRARMAARGWPTGEIDAVIAQLRSDHARRRRNGQTGTPRPVVAHACAPTPHDAWRHRHPRLTDTTIRLVIAELRRTRTGAA